MCCNVYEIDVETTNDIYLIIKYFYIVPKFALKITYERLSMQFSKLDVDIMYK
jgi:hypothetical protein